LRVVVREREPLHVTEELGAVVPQHPLPGEGRQEGGCRVPELRGETDGDRQGDRDAETDGAGPADRERYHGVEEAGKRPLSEEAVDGDLERQRGQERERRGEQGERE